MPASPSRPWYARTGTLLLAPLAVLLLYIALTLALGLATDGLARGGHGTLAAVVRVPFAFLFYGALFPVVGVVCLEFAAIVIVLVRWWGGRGVAER